MTPDYKAPRGPEPPLTPLIQKSLHARAEAFDMDAWLLGEARWWASEGWKRWTLLAADKGFERPALPPWEA